MKSNIKSQTKATKARAASKNQRSENMGKKFPENSQKSNGRAAYSRWKLPEPIDMHGLLRKTNFEEISQNMQFPKVF